MWTRSEIKKLATEALLSIQKGVDGRDVMALGMSVNALYQEYFEVKFPRELFRINEPEGNSIETMARCIIDGKPYEPPVADVATG